MNKKTTIRFIMLMAIGGVIGFFSSIGLLVLDRTGAGNLMNDIGSFVVVNALWFLLGMTVVLFIPAIYFNIIGRRLTVELTHIDDEQLEAYEIKSESYLDKSLGLNSVYMISTLVFIGMVFSVDVDHFWVVLIVFMTTVIGSAVVETSTIRFIQRNDTRLKGDPTSFKFHKDFLESCDEAEKLRIYMSGYNAYMFSRNVTIGLLVVVNIMNMVLDAGPLPVLFVGIVLLTQIASYYIYSVKSKTRKASLQ